VSVHLLHYRAWRGGFRSSWWGVWPIARTALGQLFRRRLFWVLFAAGMLLFLMFFFGSFLLDWAEGQLTTAPIQIGKLKADPERVAKFFRQGMRILNGSQDTFAYFFVYQGGMVMIVLALAGAVLVGNDHTQRSLPFYLAKPIHPWQYLLGKMLAVGVVVNLMTTAPALGLYLQHGFDDLQYLTNVNFFVENNLGRGPAGWRLFVGLLGFALIMTVFLSIVLVAAASWARRTVPLVMVWTSVFMFLRLVSGILVDGLQYGAGWRLLDLWNSMCILGFGCLGFERRHIWPAPQPPFWAAALTLLGVCILCLMYLNRRTRSVEIVR
jgi:hypothetical protein